MKTASWIGNLATCTRRDRHGRIHDVGSRLYALRTKRETLNIKKKKKNWHLSSVYFASTLSNLAYFCYPRLGRLFRKLRLSLRHIFIRGLGTKVNFK